jgi:predicted ribosomally synthesized peptide with SipW-like signal peptide
MKRLLVYAAILAAVLSVGGARAYFTAQTEVKDSMITAGTVAISTEPTSAPLTIDALAPGETVSRSIEVRNTGTLAVDAITTAAKKAGITDFWNALQCRVTCGGVELYSGSLAAMRTTPVRLGAGGSATITYAIALPADAPNALQGDYVKASVYIDAEQIH